MIAVGNPRFSDRASFSRLWLYCLLVCSLFLPLFQAPAYAAPASDGFDYPVGNREPRDGYQYYVAQDFGNHLGEDWNRGSGDTDYGDSVYAASNGEVVVSQDFGGPNGWGQVIMIRSDTPEGVVTTMYAHLSRRNVSVGNVVRKGAWIGSIGKSGGPWGSSNSAHLHFELRLNDRTDNGSGYGNPVQGQVDPSNWIDAHRNLSPGFDPYDQNGRDRWTNNPDHHVFSWRIWNKDAWGQSWDVDPGQQFSSNDGHLIFRYIEDENARQGWHRARIRAWIGDRYWDLYSEPYGFDSRAPVVSLTGGSPPGSVLKYGERISWHIDDPHCGIKHWGQAWDGDPGPQYNTADGWLDVSEGTHTLNVHTWDNLDNNYNWGPSQGWVWTVLPPPPADLHLVEVTPNRAVLAWSDRSVTEQVFEIWRRTGNGPYEHIDNVGTDVTQYTNTGLQAGVRYVYQIRAATDRGSSDGSNELAVTTPDPNPPVIRITPEPLANGQWFLTNQTVSWTVTDGGGVPSTVTVRWDNNPPFSTSPSGNAPIPQGQHTLTVSAQDDYGNQTSLSKTYRLDTLPPVITIATPPAGSGIRSFGTISGTALDEGSGVREVKVRLLRASDNKWWKPGTGWVSAVSYLDVTGKAVWASRTVPPVEQLPAGAYYIYGAATDNLGRTGNTRNLVVVDRQLPTVQFTTPTNGAIVRALTRVTGKALDEAGGSGIVTVSVRLRRGSDAKSWNGVGWQDAAFMLRTNNATTWSVTDPLPTGLNLPDGVYYLTAAAWDRSGNVAQAFIAFRIDTAAPISVIFTAPTAGSTIRTLPRITGKALDNSGGGGIAKVSVRIRRGSDAKSWNGAGWQDAAFMLPTNNTPSWTVTSALPTGANLPDGIYYLTAIAWDWSGGSLQTTISFRVDTVVPSSLAITRPGNGTSVTQLLPVEGTAGDNSGGSGIQSVGITVRRLNDPARTDDDQWWTGSGWGASAVPRMASSTATAPATPFSTWRLTTGLPGGTNLSPGKYQIFATATDATGLTKTTYVIVTRP